MTRVVVSLFSTTILLATAGWLPQADCFVVGVARSQQQQHQQQQQQQASTTTAVAAAWSSSNHQEDSSSPSLSRRDALQQAAATLALTATTTTAMPLPSLASGGATAGGAYLLSAKQRYNDRVKAGVKGYLQLRAALETDSIDQVRAFFATEDVGGWKDWSAAGYLLANAFRRNSSAAPDSLPSVKAWKKFAGQVGAVAGALKKKDTKGALAAFEESLPLLDDYLSKIELAPASELVG